MNDSHVKSGSKCAQHHRALDRWGHEARGPSDCVSSRLFLIEWYVTFHLGHTRVERQHSVESKFDQSSKKDYGDMNDPKGLRFTPSTIVHTSVAQHFIQDDYLSIGPAGSRQTQPATDTMRA